MVNGIDLTSDEINTAFESDQFSVLYQPIVPLADHGTITAVEALVRLNHPQHGVIAPAKFLNKIAEMGLMYELSACVISRVASDWTAWRDAGQELSVSVNLDRSLLDRRTLAKDISALVEKTQLPNKRLSLEICGNHHGSLTRPQVEQITRLRMKGFRIAFDNLLDSSVDMEQLTELPLERLKLDFSIIRQLKSQLETREQVRKILTLASKLGADVVAVGVESEWALDWLKRQGCTLGQGYLFGPPLAVEAFQQVYLQSHQRWQVDKMPERLNLLVLDDDPQYQVLLYEALSDAYNVVVANTIEEARGLFVSHEPKLLVLDVLLPDGSGLELCKEFTQQVGEDAFSAIFVSGKDDVNARLDAYSAGAVDFLTKPFPMVDLVAKLDRAAQAQQNKSKMVEQSDELRNAFLGSMKEAAHYGDVVQFLKNLFACYDEKAVANELFRFMKSKGLSCSVQFRSPASIVSFSQDAMTCSPMEINVFELLCDRGRIQDFKQRTIFNDRHVSVLIKNMPKDEEEKGRIRDYMAALIEGMEARFTDILRQRLLASVGSELKSLAKDLANNLAEDKQRNREMMEKATLDLQMSFHLLNLTEEQENHITGIIESMHKSSEESEESGQKAGERINYILQLLTRVEQTPELQSSVSTSSGEDDGVELF